MDDRTDEELSRALILIYDEVDTDCECEHGFHYDDCPNKDCACRALQENFLIPILKAANFIRLRAKGET